MYTSVAFAALTFKLHSPTSNNEMVVIFRFCPPQSYPMRDATGFTNTKIASIIDIVCNTRGDSLNYWLIIIIVSSIKIRIVNDMQGNII